MDEDKKCPHCGKDMYWQWEMKCSEHEIGHFKCICGYALPYEEKK